MFSPETTTYSSTSTRNPRRRQRNTSEDSLVVQPKRRKRSSLAPDTFEPPIKPKANGHVPVANGHVVPRDNSFSQKQREVSVDTTTLSVRTRNSKRVDRERRAPRLGDVIIQAKTENYIVTKHLDVPEALSAHVSKEQYRVDFSPSLGYAVATTHSSVIVWRHVSHLSDDNAKSYIIKIPYPNGPHDPLPLAKLVHDSNIGELALLVVMPLTGKLVYWESVSRAATTDTARQSQQGLYGTAGSVFSGETITSITEAELDCFVLGSDTGRMIHVSIRDAQGRLAISTQYLRGSSTGNTGLFGTLRGFIGSMASKRDIAGIRALPLHSKGHRKCISVTRHGQLQFWNLARHSAKSLISDIDIRPALLSVFQDDESDPPVDFQVIDFELATHSGNDTTRLMILTSIQRKSSSDYHIIDADLHLDGIEVNITHPVRCYHENPSVERKSYTIRPRLLIPPPGHTAFVVFHSAIVVASLVVVEQSPSSQLQLEAHQYFEDYQETLRFNSGKDYHVVGCEANSSHRKDEKATISVFVRNFGLVSTSTFPAKMGQTPVERSEELLRTTIEQAVFFGTQQDNLLDFGARNLHDMDVTLIRDAILWVNDSILDSSSKYVTKAAPNTGEQLADRAKALRHLAIYAHHFPLDEATRWKLLWSAEKMAAAIALWQNYSTLMTEKEAESEEPALLSELIEMINEKHKHENDPSRGETDNVRHFLTYDVQNIYLVIVWAEQSLELIHKHKGIDLRHQGSLVDQASDIQIALLEGAFKFRVDSCSAYGFLPEDFKHGIFQGNSSDLPLPWTATGSILVKTKELTDITRETVLSNDDSPNDVEEPIDMSLLTKMATTVPKLVNLCCLVYEERLKWLKSQSDDQSQRETPGLEQSYAQVRKDLIVSILELELPEEALNLAEKFEDMDVLAEVLVTSIGMCSMIVNRAGADEDDVARAKLLLDGYDQCMERYFKKHGEKWADALYSRYISDGQLSPLTEEVPEYRWYLTQFLRSRPELSKLSWLNEASVEASYQNASQALNSAQTTESNLWSKRVELSLSRLASLAALEKEEVDQATVGKSLTKCARRMEIIDIQDELYAYVHPSLRAAIDETAESQMAMQSFGTRLEDQPALQSTLKENFDKLIPRQVIHGEDLIDTLTLMNLNTQAPDKLDFGGRRFDLALRLVKLGGFEARRRELHEKLIWRRAYLQDDWVQINRTENLTDEAVERATSETALFKTLVAGFADDDLTNTTKSFRPLGPAEVSGAGISLEQLRESSRYDGWTDAFLKALASDLKREDDKLERMMRRGRLELWFEGCVQAAKNAVRSEADRKGEEEAEVLGEEQRLINGVGDENGSVVNGIDAEGDVVMTREHYLL